MVVAVWTHVRVVSKVGRQARYFSPSIGADVAARIQCSAASVPSPLNGLRSPPSFASRNAPRPFEAESNTALPKDNDAGSISKSFAQYVATTTIPSSRGPLKVSAFRTAIGDVLAVVSGIGNGRRVPVRVHDACLTGEVLGSLKCDCGLQLEMALDEQSKQQLGVTIYMPQEGRGIGLANKIAAYSLQEDKGLDTVDANLALGLPVEMRNYAAVQRILEDIGVMSVLLMTNNPFKVAQLHAAGVLVEGVLPLLAAPKAEVTSQYLETKRLRMGHMLPKLEPKETAPQEDLEGPLAKLVMEFREEVRRAQSDASRSIPFTLLSFASSLDGFIARYRSGSEGGVGESAAKEPVALSGEASMALTHHLRGSVDAILVGVGTVLVDDPLLDVRVDGAGPSPRPVVLDSRLRLPPDCRLLTHRPSGGRAPTVVLCAETEADAEGLRRRAAALEAAGAIVLRCQTDSRGQVCLRDALRRLQDTVGVRSVMVEGGSDVIRSFLSESQRSSLVDRVIVTQAPKLLGSGVPWAVQGGPCLTEVSSFILGHDAIFSGRLSMAELPKK
ncbi:unnamed protein product [Polarella glacialis]|uniref:GTP cyclohydrolase II n=1 Tax=Polarella glacialis TaxID=89957 RepID=A0A813GRZ1_POLGL|nr:unnamed protein product [Polarella glacialis]CAE8628094.1 unnamed protein product [Polarella glacialis]